ncbi:cyclic peptide export ABC transporter [Chitinivorax sp. B]|uniref:cyclic peptide export ABC transporter n=1 Tax=Chitinivorax sp. B TaxID=2502235 RepID=UPI0010F86F27|nr:cyclic peptide export ABC transporter [Chitinivorax sp. B]
MLRNTLYEHRWRLLACSLLCAVAAGINIFLLDYLHEVAQQADARPLMQWLPTYAGGVLLMFLLSLLANLLLVFLACRMVARMRETLVRQILATRYAHLERAGKGALLATLTDDVANMSEGMVTAPQFIFNALSIVLCLGYLVYLSAAAFVYFFAMLLIGVVLTVLIANRGNLYYERYRELKDKYYANLHAMFDGAKELAINRHRRQHFLQREILPSIGDLKSAELMREIYWNISENWTRIFLFIGLGVAVVVTRSVTDASAGLTMSYFIAITFMTGPIDFVINAFSSISKALVSARAVSALKLDVPNEPPVGSPSSIPEDWREIDFDNVSYTTAGASEDESFHFGPVSLTIRRGEMLFVTGGNGSGKSTFGKLLVGLYQRQGGEIRVGGQLIEAGEEVAYRSLFGTVFSDYYLFSSLLDHRGQPTDGAQVVSGLDRLGLADKVQIDRNGYLSTTSLSQGQRKRLALLQSWLGDSPIYLFDEWAADQDPHFRDEFYRDILPTMQRQGKTLIIISHDDRYFHLADRICKFELGKLIHVGLGAALTPPLPGDGNPTAMHANKTAQLESA